jgi:hypothetical protein
LAGLTLDAGALIAADRGDHRVVALLERLAIDRVRVTIPCVAVAQSWRGGGRSARLARLIGVCAMDALDLAQAQATGELLARSRTSDAIDAAVVISAAGRGDAILTTDPHDLRVLAASMPGMGPILDLRAL